jgi:hypothetical protein
MFNNDYSPSIDGSITIIFSQIKNFNLPRLVQGFLIETFFNNVDNSLVDDSTGLNISYTPVAG